MANISISLRSREAKDTYFPDVFDPNASEIFKLIVHVN